MFVDDTPESSNFNELTSKFGNFNPNEKGQVKIKSKYSCNPSFFFNISLKSSET